MMMMCESLPYWVKSKAEFNENRAHLHTVQQKMICPQISSSWMISISLCCFQLIYVCNGFANHHKVMKQRRQPLSIRRQSIHTSNISPYSNVKNQCRQQISSSLQAIVYDNSMHTAISNLIQEQPSQNYNADLSSSLSLPTMSSNNNDIISNWLKNTATVDIMEMSHIDDDFSSSSSTSYYDDKDTTKQQQQQIDTTINNNNIASSTILSSSSFSPSSSYRTLTNDEITTLQNAFSAFYGNGQGTTRNLNEANELFTKCIHIWIDTQQGGDEIAGLYRVRGDLNMELFQPNEAYNDYTKSIEYLQGNDGYKADENELPSSYLGRARTIRSLGNKATVAQAKQASNDYEVYFRLTSSLDNESSNSKNEGGISDVIIDGMQKNPYAAWEWGMVNRVAQDYGMAAEIHRLSMMAFGDIGDKPRSVICDLDRGIDLASLEGSGSSKVDSKQLSIARKILEDAIESDVNVEGRDVELLQRLVAKEGEARTALAGILWNSNAKAAAESQYGTACTRLDELNADYQRREQLNEGRMAPPKPSGVGLGYSIDDINGANEASCSRFKNDKFVEEKLVWSEDLQTKVKKFLTLSQ